MEYLCDKVAVMYLGRIMEYAGKRELYGKPLHPYTKALLSAIPVPDIHAKRDEVILQGELPSPLNPPTGCLFSTRCPMATDQCRQSRPELTEITGRRWNKEALPAFCISKHCKNNMRKMRRGRKSTMEVKQIIAEIKEKMDQRGGLKHMYFVACGGSKAAIFPGLYLIQSEAKISSATTYTSNEFVHATPKELDERCIAVICSLKATPETVKLSKQQMQREQSQLP